MRIRTKRILAGAGAEGYRHFYQRGRLCRHVRVKSSWLEKYGQIEVLKGRAQTCKGMHAGVFGPQHCGLRWHRTFWTILHRPPLGSSGGGQCGAGLFFRGAGALLPSAIRIRPNCANWIHLLSDPLPSV